MVVPLEHLQILVAGDRRQFDQVRQLPGQPAGRLMPAPAAGVTPARQAVGLDLSLWPALRGFPAGQGPRCAAEALPAGLYAPDGRGGAPAGSGSDAAAAQGVRLAVSSRMRRRRRQIARMHSRMADTRRDHLHQVTARAVRMARVVCIEDLAVKAMARGMGGRGSRRSVHHAALGEVRRQLACKAGWLGRVVSAVARFYPSSLARPVATSTRASRSRSAAAHAQRRCAPLDADGMERRQAWGREPPNGLR